jgi:hypothetical protein
MGRVFSPKYHNGLGGGWLDIGVGPGVPGPYGVRPTMP